jgi:hypothetical protein
MPNWCECDLTVFGPRAKVEEFLQFARSEESTFDFNRFVPYPEEWQRMDERAAAWDRENWGKEDVDWAKRPKDGFNSGGHAWCVENWGTKWTARRVTHEPSAVWHSGEEATVAVQFETAWSPPLPLVRKAAVLFPDVTLDLRYFERGMQYHGVLVCRGADVLENECGRYFGHRGG